MFRHSILGATDSVCVVALAVAVDPAPESDVGTSRNKIQKWYQKTSEPEPTEEKDFELEHEPVENRAESELLLDSGKRLSGRTKEVNDRRSSIKRIEASRDLNAVSCNDERKEASIRREAPANLHALRT